MSYDLWVWAAFGAGIFQVLAEAHSCPCCASGWFTPVAEITNGRAAMLAFGILLFLEYKSGVPLF